MIDDNVTAIIRYFVNESMKFDETDMLEATPIYGHSVTVPATSSTPLITSTKAASSSTAAAAKGSGDSSFQNAVIIPLYAIIFGCCVIGNLFVILTLAQNKRMRTVTNVYLLNLVSSYTYTLFCGCV